MKARCIHGHVWFQPCEICEAAEILWLAKLQQLDRWRQQLEMMSCFAPPAPCVNIDGI